MLPSALSFRAFCWIGPLAAVLLSSCSGPQLTVLDRPVSETKTSRALTDSSALEQGTRDALRQEDLLKTYRRDPGVAITELVGRYERQPTEPRRRALAEMCSDQADRLTEEFPVAALGHYLDAAWLTEKAAVAAVGSEVESPERTIYDYSALRVTRLMRVHPEITTGTISAPGSVRQWRLSRADGAGEVDPSHYDLVVPASWLKSKGIKWEPVTQDGFGAAMVGHRAATPERKAVDALMPSAGRGFPLNATFRFSGGSATLVLQDLMADSRVEIAGQSVPLAGDFSAALSFIYYEDTERISKLAALLRPGSHDGMIGMNSLEPFRQDKIPLVLVHGLMSTSEGWLPFINLLLADPVVRERYQIVMFNYPTGNVISRNAADLRAALADFQQTNDPQRRNPHMRNMVILGHSMGGMISNMQIRTSGDRIYRTVFAEDLEDLDMGAEEKEEIRQLAFFDANPDIDRALLLAAPLRGSDFATNKIGQFGAWLIRMPFNLVDSILGDIELIDVLTDVAQEASQRPLNSVSGLRPDNPILAKVLESPVRQGVEIHSIIARSHPDDPLLESSDGVVPYTSAHLDEAVSEKIIENANHRSMVAKDETIEEVLRILYLHAGVSRR